MKTQINKLQKEQAIGNKVVLYSLLIFGIIVFSTSGHNFLQAITDYSENTFSTSNGNNSDYKIVAFSSSGSLEKKESMNMTYIIPLEADLSFAYQHKLEIKRLDEIMQKNSRFVYQQMLTALADVEEPELLIEDVLSQLDIQAEILNRWKPNRFTQAQNAELNEMYKQKNLETWNELKQSDNLNNMLLVENESKLNIEVWMTEGNYWELSDEDNKDIEKSLAEMYTKKNAEVYESIKKEMTFRNWAKIETEEPLLVEVWMAKESVNTFDLPLVANEYLTTLVESKMNEVNEMIDLLKRAKCCGIIETEEPLAVESWMISERCWCPNKKQTKYLYNESFAMKAEK